MRVALYWAPALDDPLHDAGSAWLGRDAETGAARKPSPPHFGGRGLGEGGVAAGHQLIAMPGAPPHPTLSPKAGGAGYDAIASPAHYGFHATLRAPMRLSTGWAEFMAAADALARSTAPFAMPPLLCGEMDGALALLAAAPCPALHALADACVAATDPHRLPPGEAELARRRRAKLSALQEAMLLRWGYPYVMEAWRFHVTLTRRLSGWEAIVLRPAAKAHFAAALGLPRMVRELCVFTQSHEAAPFLIAERLALIG